MLNASFFGEAKGTELNIPTFALFPEDRKELHRRIALRFEQMLGNGFLDEVRSLKEIPGLTKDHSSIRCVGYRQAWDYLDGLTSFDEFKEAGACGTAAVITPIGGIEYKDKLHVFYSETEVGPITKELYRILCGIQFGDVEAPEGWIFKVE